MANPTVLILCREPAQAMQWREPLLATRLLDVVGITNAAESARSMLAKHSADVVLSDLHLLDGPAAKSIGRLRGNPNAETPHIVMVAHDDEDPALLESLRAGADSYFVFGRGADSLPDSVRKTLIGESHITQAVAKKVLRAFEINAPAPGSHAIDEMLNPLQLTPLEHKLLSRVAAGEDLEQIGDKDSVSQHALGTAVRGIYRKLRWTLRAGALSLQAGGSGNADPAWTLRPVAVRNR